MSIAIAFSVCLSTGLNYVSMDKGWTFPLFPPSCATCQGGRAKKRGRGHLHVSLLIHTHANLHRA